MVQGDRITWGEGRVGDFKTREKWNGEVMLLNMKKLLRRKNLTILYKFSQTFMNKQQYMQQLKDT